MEISLLIFEFVLFISTILLLRKFTEVKSLSILGSVIPRIYTMAIIIAFLYFDTPPDVIFIHVGVILIFISDVINSLVERYTHDYNRTKNLVSTLDTLSDIQDKFYLALENAQIGYYIINSFGRFEYTNKIFSELTGYSREELRKMSVYDLSQKDKHAEIEELIDAKILNKRKTTQLITSVIRKDGSEFTARIVGTRTENGHPTITGTIIALEDTVKWTIPQLS